MSRLQELHPDQQAVLQLVLRRRLPYADLGDLLGLDAEGVRERALDAIDGLAPDDVPGLDPADRDRIADHLLGQDRGSERRATATLLATQAPAHAWATTIAVELEPLGGPVEKVPAVPGAAAGEPVSPASTAGTVSPSASSVPVGDPVAAPAAARPRRQPSAAATPPADAAPAGPAAPALPRNPLADQPKGLIAGGLATVVVVILLVVWISGGFSGGDSESASTPPAATSTAADDTASTEAAAAQFVSALPQSIPFRAPTGATGAFARVTGTGTPTVSSTDASTPVISLAIQNLPAATSTQRYYAWADKNGADPIFLGELSDPSGAELLFQGLDVKTRQATVVDPSVYTTMRITRETSENPTEPGPTVISGRITPSN